MRLSVGVLCDPLHTLRPHHDSTLAIMRECIARGHEVLAFEQRDLQATGRLPWAHMREVRLDGEGRARSLGERDLPLATLDAVLLRKDPPVDAAFNHATRLVELAQGPLLINRPSSLRDCNEKLFALRFPSLIPQTTVSSDPQVLREQVEQWPDGAVLKPLDGFGGQGVFITRGNDGNLGSIIEAVTAHGTLPALVQRFLPGSREGDKRILLVDGHPVGAILRVAGDLDHRCNMAAGGRAVATQLTERDLQICRTLAPELRARGLVFVGIDVIAGHLIEINVTSPTGIEEAAQLSGARVAEGLVDWIEHHAPQRSRESHVTH